MPVFLAERLSLGKLIFHRTCLKCARCNSQLSPGSFYETEEDGVFCCETCPDEEKESTISLTDRLDLDNLPTGGLMATNGDGRKSFAEKLAMFQNDNDKGLLRKSLSDEEKSRSLKRLSALYGGTTVEYKKNAALNNFMSSQVEANEAEPQTTSQQSSLSINVDQSESSSDEDNTESEENPNPVIDDNPAPSQQPPSLPVTLPPASAASTSCTTASPHISAATKDKKCEPSVCELLIDPIGTMTFVCETKEITDEHSSVDSSCKVTNIAKEAAPIDVLSNNVTKEDDDDDNRSTVTADVTTTTPTNIQSAAITVDDSINNTDEHVDVDEVNNIIRNSSSNSSMVRSRLNQFEKLIAVDSAAETTTTTTSNCSLSLPSDVDLNISDSCNTNSCNDDQSVPIIIVADVVPTEQQQQQQQAIDSDKNVISCEDLAIVKNICESDHNGDHPYSDSNNEDDHDVLSEIKENSDMSGSIDSGIANSLPNLPKIFMDASVKVTENVDDRPEPVELSTVVVKPISSEGTCDEVISNDQVRPLADHLVLPTPRQRASKVNSDFSGENAGAAPPTPVKRRTVVKPEVKPRSPLPLQKVFYPESLNPFGSDDETDEPQPAPSPVPLGLNKAKRDSLNPFDSDDDEIELLKSSLINHSAAQASTIKAR